MAKRIGDLKRNDIEGALEAAEDLIKAKQWDPTYAEILYMLQDNPEKLDKPLGDLLARYGIKEEG